MNTLDRRWVCQRSSQRRVFCRASPSVLGLLIAELLAGLANDNVGLLEGHRVEEDDARDELDPLDLAGAPPELEQALLQNLLLDLLAQLVLKLGSADALEFVLDAFLGGREGALALRRRLQLIALHPM